MRFKRRINPIFVEEEQYLWGRKRKGLRIVIVVILLFVLAGLGLAFLALSEGVA